MSHPALRLPSVPFRLSAMGVLVPTLLLALYLSVAPQVHERIHPRANNTAHECVVTMFASGNCEHVTDAPINVVVPAPPFSSVLLCERLSIFSAAVETSILEHAPPQNS